MRERCRRDDPRAQGHGRCCVEEGEGEGAGVEEIPISPEPCDPFKAGAMLKGSYPNEVSEKLQEKKPEEPFKG